jgi:hypothetical protein
MEFRTKVIRNAAGNPMLKLPPRSKYRDLPLGEALVVLPDGSRWVFRFVKIACNLARPETKDEGNYLPELLLDFFGPRAGEPGRQHYLVFCWDDDFGMLTAEPE